MKIVEFSVTNYRSVTTAHRIKLQNLTVLVGKNNEGKSNILSALNVAMRAVMRHGCAMSRGDYPRSFGRYGINYDWKRDFPIQLQQRKSGTESIFKLIFRLEGDELNEFHSLTGIRGNEDIPISVKIGKDNIPKIEVPKRGSSSYNRKSSQITGFISQRISFNYIKAIRTEKMAIDALQDAIDGELQSLNDNPEYVEALKKVSELQQGVLDQISSQLLDPLRVFLPSLQSITIKKDDESSPLRYGFHRNEIEVIVDDGVATSISNKGDGIKSLITLAILKNRRVLSGASIIAIEEPESHLHSGAIHNLADVINKISDKNQVIVTTHNPLFVQQNNVSSNIIVDAGTARAAKNIAEIRDILGVLPSDNLRNSRFVIVVEGEDDAISLSKILPAYSEKIKHALQSNIVVIKALGGAGNLSHDLADLKRCMCKYVVLLDNDEAGITAGEKAIQNGLLSEADLRYTICNGSPEAEFEDCLQPSLYENLLMDEFRIDINSPEFRGNKKWSERLKNVCLSQGVRWTETIEQKIKFAIAQNIPDAFTNLDEIVVSQKSGFINGLVTAIEHMIEE